jgi:hypothetical protein
MNVSSRSRACRWLNCCLSCMYALTPPFSRRVQRMEMRVETECEWRSQPRRRCRGPLAFGGTGSTSLAALLCNSEYILLFFLFPSLLFGRYGCGCFSQIHRTARTNTLGATCRTIPITNTSLLKSSLGRDFDLTRGRPSWSSSRRLHSTNKSGKNREIHALVPCLLTGGTGMLAICDHLWREEPPDYQYHRVANLATLPEQHHTDHTAVQTKPPLNPNQAHPPSSSSQPASSNTNAPPFHASPYPPPARSHSQAPSEKPSTSDSPSYPADDRPKAAPCACAPAAPASAQSTPAKTGNNRCHLPGRRLQLARLSSPCGATRRA